MPSENIPVKVVAKCRPLTEDEKQKGCKKIVKVSGEKIIVEAAGKDQSYTFDTSFPEDAKASQVYSDCCDSLVQRALNGYNVSILAFGATGSGKSYLMSGTEGDPGIIPCVNKNLFKYMDAKKDKKFFITVSFLEIQDEKMTDMLNPHNKPMKIREHPQLGIFVDELSELVVNDVDDLQRIYEQGNRARKMGTSNIQAHRARSHGIFTIHIEQKESNSSKVGVRSSVILADLAGIEATGGSSAVTPENNGVRALQNVISALKSGGHVPYRDSKVTRVLTDSLGGNSATLILTVLSPSDSSYQATSQTLQLAQNARNLKNKVKINLDETTSIITELREEISRLRKKITKSPETNKDDVLKMEHLIRDLEIAKQQTWEEKARLSAQYEEERKTNLANKGILEWVMDTMQKGTKEVQERALLLQKEKDQLSLEYRDKRGKVDGMKDDLQKKIADYSKLAESGKAKDTEVKQHVTAIHELKEALKRETELLKEIKKRLKEVQDRSKSEREAAQGQIVVKGNAELRHLVEAEERRRMENDNKAMIAEEIERMKIETEHEKAEIQMAVSQGKTYSNEEATKLDMELVDLKSERSVVTLQIQALQQEKERLKADLDGVQKRHKEELEIQQLQHFQTFRQYRDVFEQQKTVLEQRYRNLVEESVQDAIYLSARNSELMEENQQLRKEGAELKDKVTVLGGRQS